MVPINGPMIREEATEIAKKLNKPAREYYGLACFKWMAKVLEKSLWD